MSRWLLVGVAIAAAALLPQVFVESELFARTISVAGICLILWLTEVAPPFVPTLVLWALVPLMLGPVDPKFSLAETLRWAIDPVLALFFGGFVLGIGAEKYGLDRQLIRRAVRASGASFAKLLLLVILVAAFLSMWLSNIAAAALMFACLRPALSEMDGHSALRRVLLVGVALGADLGGMATPIGTGPNAVAIAAVAAQHHISFIGWMAFAFPLTVGMLLVTFLMLRWRARKSIREWTVPAGVLSDAITTDEDSVRSSYRRIFLFSITAATVFLWLSEPLHGISSATVSLAASAALFLSGVLGKGDLFRIDWSTLILISGGITLGRLLEASNIVRTSAAGLPFSDFDPAFGLFLICFVTAMLSALMSNTAAVIMIIPLAMSLIPSPSTAILVAISASFGLPFLISTPPNAMAFGEGGVEFKDLFWPGIVLMLFGCLVVSTTGPYIMNLAGIP